MMAIRSGMLRRVMLLGPVGVLARDAQQLGAHVGKAGAGKALGDAVVQEADGLDDLVGGE